MQGLPYLLVGLSLLLDPDPGDTVLTLVVLAPLLSGLAGGVSVTAWREYIAKSIPADRRASLWAIRFVLGGGIGVLAGQLVSVILNRYPETRAYGLLHLAVFALMSLSYGVFALSREPNLDSTRPHASTSWWSYARAMTRIVREDSRLGPYLGCRALFSGLYVVLPFLTLRALTVLQLPDAYLGRLLMFQMVGSVVGDLVGGYLGDRRGGKLVMLLSQAGSILVAIAATALASALAFKLLFMALGLAVGFGGVGVPTERYQRRCSSLCSRHRLLRHGWGPAERPFHCFANANRHA